MRDCITQSVTNNVRLVLVGLTHEMSYTADSDSNSNRYSGFDSYSIRTQTADSQVLNAYVSAGVRAVFIASIHLYARISVTAVFIVSTSCICMYVSCIFMYVFRCRSCVLGTPVLLC